MHPRRPSGLWGVLELADCREPRIEWRALLKPRT